MSFPSPLSAFAPNTPQRGAIAALGAFFVWGILPIFWKALASVDSVEVLFQRILWSFVTMFLFMLFTGRLGSTGSIFTNPKSLLVLMGSGLALACNWYLYIWAINSNQIIEASLGYFINPLLNIITGMLFFKEKISKIAWIAIGIAFAGVFFRIVSLGHFPFIALGLSGAFAIYGLLRKIVIAEALPGLFVETLLMMPFAVAYLSWKAFHGSSAFFLGNVTINVLMVSAGVITTIPLFWFAYGARLLRMTTIGLMQYITPSIVFLLGIFVYKEPLSLQGLFTFMCIWCAVALYSWDSFQTHKAAKAAKEAAA